MKDALDIDWAEATAYEIVGALRFSGVLTDDYQSEQTARMEIAAVLRRRCVPIGQPISQDEPSRQPPPERGEE